ncbi:hypothetical protein CASFOL_019387 [Castilleja foliolosa]|uniref:VQ domain-containing protein n=1 Tax=Castilleja foliolosa TaxID=1961234 RepID=A0ABD3D481_9LAMI
MASSDNMMTMEQPWSFRPAFADAWVSDYFSKETDTLTKALQMSFADTSSDGDGGVFSPAGMVESILMKPDAPPLQTPTGSGCSENEAFVAAAVSKPRRSLPPSGGRVAKRKSRASKRATTTFINADAANFRQMVQQVTGVGFAGGLPAANSAILKPEPHRLMNRVQIGGGGLPTFDPSSFLLDGPASNMVAQPPTAATGADGNGIDFDSFYSFPTLESWKVM